MPVYDKEEYFKNILGMLPSREEPVKDDSRMQEYAEAMRNIETRRPRRRELEFGREMGMPGGIVPGREEADLERRTRRAAIANAILGGVTGISEGIKEGLQLPGADRAGAFARTQALHGQIMGPLEQMRAKRTAQEQLRMKLAAKQKSKEDKHYIKGFEYKGKGIHSDTTINKVKDRVAATSELVRLTDDLIEHLEANKGFINPLSKAGREAQQMIRHLNVVAKEYYKLGALTAADMEIVEGVLPNPTQLKELVQAGQASDLFRSAQYRWAKSTKENLGQLDWEIKDWDLKDYLKKPVAKKEKEVKKEEKKPKKDPIIEAAAKRNKTTYEIAKKVLIRKGYTPKED